MELLKIFANNAQKYYDIDVVNQKEIVVANVMKWTPTYKSAVANVMYWTL